MSNTMQWVKASEIDQNNLPDVVMTVMGNGRVFAYDSWQNYKGLKNILNHHPDIICLCFNKSDVGKPVGIKEAFDYSENELKRLYEWVMDEKRKSAQTFFTSGWLRNVATEIQYRFKSLESGGGMAEALDDLLEAIPKQSPDADWWPDELTRAVEKAKSALGKP